MLYFWPRRRDFYFLFILSSVRMALWLSQKHRYVNCYCFIPVDFIRFLSVARVSSRWTIGTFCSCFCVETETPCSLVVPASKKSDNSEGQMQNTRRFFYTPVIACQYINLFLSSQKKFCKKGIIVVIGNATQHEGEVRKISVTSYVEKYVFFSMSEVSLRR